jgi:hypothetical protein
MKTNNASAAALAAKRRQQQQAAKEQAAKTGRQEATKASYKVQLPDGKGTKEVPGWLNRGDDLLTALTRKGADKTNPEMPFVRLTPLMSRSRDVYVHRLSKYTAEGKAILIDQMKMKNPTWQDYLCTFRHHDLPENWKPSQFWRFTADAEEGDRYEIRWPNTSLDALIQCVGEYWVAVESIPVQHGRDETAQKYGGVLSEDEYSYLFADPMSAQAFVETLIHESQSCALCAKRAEHDLAVRLHRKDRDNYPLPDYEDYLGTRDDSKDPGTWCPVGQRQPRTLIPAMDHSWLDVTPAPGRKDDRMVSYARRVSSKRADGSGYYIRGALIWITMDLMASGGKQLTLFQNLAQVLNEAASICRSCVGEDGKVQKGQHHLTTREVVCAQCGHPAPILITDTDGEEYLAYLDQDTVASRDDLLGAFSDVEFDTQCSNCGTVGEWAVVRDCSTCDDPAPLDPANVVLEATYDAGSKAVRFRLFRSPKDGRVVFDAAELARTASTSGSIKDWPADLRACRDALLTAPEDALGTPFVSFRTQADAAKVVGLDMFQHSA